MQTPNLADGNFAALSRLFPNAVTETIDENGAVVRAIDADVLAQEINTRVVAGREERYQFTWPDKKKSVLLANAPIAAALRPCREESVDFDTTENLYIEGDNLDVLKCLRETYLNKVKMIYIDPPYNTGNDFVYEDDFAGDADEFLSRDGQFDEQGNRLVKNLDSNGRFHTDWLNMMYPRLRVARDLLTEDGVIFISIDDNEVENLKKICNEVFGAINSVSMFPRVTKKGGKSSDVTAKNHDYVLMYAKNVLYADLVGISHDDSGYSNEDEYFETRGYYKANQTLDYDSLGYVRTLDYPINIGDEIFYAGGDIEMYNERQKGQHGRADWGWRWRWSKDLFDFGLANGFIEIHRGGARPRIYTKTYQKVRIERIGGNYKVVEFDRTKPLSTLEFTENKYSNDNAKKVFDDLMEKGVFEYTKPPELIAQLERLVNGNDFITLDFFSGSATTAHAVMQLNAEDGGKRKFILVQLPELTDEKSEAYKAGYKNICEIGKERIRRAGKKIKSEAGLQAQDLDIGFRVLKLDSSNMKDVYYTPEQYEKLNFDLEGFEDNIKPDRTDEDLLFQVMLELDIPLSAQITQDVGTSNGSRTFSVNDNYLIACFGGVDTALLTEIAKKHPYYAVFRDSSFISDSALVNFEQVFNTYSPNTTRRVL
jgi:adenine-specific DNA-methyltransferase